MDSSPSPTLSVCTFTNRSPRHVAQVLGSLRSVADEIVVVFDHRVSTDDFSALDGVVDRVVRAEYEVPLEANLAWMHQQCSGDWVLRLDGDELPSAALVRRLATTEWADDVTHVFVNRRWIWGDEATMLDEHPWWPDPQLRLVRNDPGLVGFSPVPHEVADVGGFARLLAEPIYHLDLLVADEAQRRAKAARYERDRPGLRTEDGRPQNLGFYVPEAATTTPATTSVAAEDAEAVAAAIDSYPHVVHRDRPDPGSVVTVAERHPEPPQPGDGAVTVVDTGPRHWREASAATVTIAVENRSSVTWSPRDEPRVRVGANLIDEYGAVVVAELRADLPAPVRPGRTDQLRLTVAPLPPPGTYRLEVGLLREDVAWFDTQATAEVTVVPVPRAVITGGFARYRHLGDDLIIGTVISALTTGLPDLEIVVLAEDPLDAQARFGPRSVGSAGDLVHRGAKASLATALRRIAVLRKDAKRYASGEAVHDPLNLPLIQTIAGAGVVVAPGAGWFTDKFRAEQVLPRLAEMEVARVLDVPYLFVAGTIGPFHGPIGRLLARRGLAGMQRVTVRDGAASADQARSLGRRDVVVEPDVATAAAPSTRTELADWLAARGIDAALPYGVVSLRDQRDTISDRDGPATIDTVVGAVNALGQRGLPVVFLPHCNHAWTDDTPAGQEVASRAPLFVDGLMPSDAVAVALIAGAAATIGNRYHLALVADAHGVPSVFLAATDFDHRRSGSFTGGNVDVVASEGEAAGASAIERALGRGRGTPAPAWDAAPLLDAVRQSLDRR
ncbi:MAG: polysaccharide pyruvyl transferase family protein [Aquihabitans sp.]